MEVCREELLSNISMYSNVRYPYFDSGYHCCKKVETNSFDKFKINLSVESPETAYINQRMVKSSFNQSYTFTYKNHQCSVQDNKLAYIYI